MAEISVHDNDKVPPCELQPVHVGSPEPQLSRPRFEDDAIGGVDGLELLGDIEGAVRGGIVNDDELPVELTGSNDAVSESIEAWFEKERGMGLCGVEEYFSVKVRFKSQVMMGRLRRSL